MFNRRIPTLALVLLAAVSLCACIHPGGGPLVAHDSLEETRALEPDGRFELTNVNGSINLATWSRSEVRIEAERSAVNDEALERIEVDIQGEGDSVRVKTRYPKRKGWFMGGNHGKVEYHITLPASAEVRLRTVNGGVHVEDVTGEIRVESVNGGLELSDVGGEVRAKTVNGGIHALYEGVPSGSRHSFQTVNGGVEIALPEGTGGKLKAKTVTGSVRCDLPLEAEMKKKRRVEGRLGPGSGVFDIGTVNGGIDVVENAAALPAEAEES